MLPSRHRIVLRYFNCRGRGQALRYLLIDHGIEFTDERLEADQSWQAGRAAWGGPFLSVPVLEWDGHQVAQTLPIASYLSRRMGHTQHLDIQETALLDAVASAAYLDLTCVIRELLRPRIMPRDEQWSGFFAELMATVRAGSLHSSACSHCTHLSAHRTALLTRPRLRAYVGSGQRPASLTASPHERSIRERLRSELQDGAGVSEAP